MLYHVIVTDMCQLNCVYCGGGMRTGRIQYRLQDLKEFLSDDPEAGIGFYGGEPLMAMEDVMRIMDEVPAKYFHLQTNGLLLPYLPTEYLKRFTTILISVDGGEEITDYYRGKGVYRSVIRALKDIRKRGYRGDVVARMVVSSHSDVYRDVSYLLSLRNPGFDHVHWQLDVFWSTEGTWDDVDFERWLEEYNRGVTRLVEDWVEGIGRGRVAGIAPFQGVTYTLLTHHPTDLRCGAGRDAFAIHPDGTIMACPISPELPFNLLGKMEGRHSTEFVKRVELDEPCRSCDMLWVCGGRCLFVNKIKPWGEKAFRQVCGTVRHLVRTLEGYLPDIRHQIERGTVKLEDFHYPRVNNGVEVIP
ncbi:MAG: putative peptide-modifying radical SAM/SPASM domain-containing protein [Thermoplasmata archaeon]|nr:MAG: putative peptide-modifying radical SAM/SPASM domain-containing protein [Thermoplasmata archaeon]RLF69868.1 MAG: putative peptide-modifying radical SAM/SPASM domain-containing protein [Thermoplasmata archaeon]